LIVTVWGRADRSGQASIFVSFNPGLGGEPPASGDPLAGVAASLDAGPRPGPDPVPVPTLTNSSAHPVAHRPSKPDAHFSITRPGQPPGTAFRGPVPAHLAGATPVRSPCRGRFLCPRFQPSFLGAPP